MFLNVRATESASDRLTGLLSREGRRMNWEPPFGGFLRAG